MAVHSNMAETINSSSASQDAISLSSLLKASQRLYSMTDITGKVWSAKGKFFVLSEKISSVKKEAENLHEDNYFLEEEKVPKPKAKSLLEQKDPATKKTSRETKPEIKEEAKLPLTERAWRQEGTIAELMISLNLVLNMYVLQIFVSNKEEEGSPFGESSETGPMKYSFYIDYDLHFRSRDAADLGLHTLLTGTALQDTGKSLVYHWKSTIDPETEYEVVVCAASLRY